MVLHLEEFWDEQAEWSQDTFGPAHTRGPVGPLKHLRKEVEEALEDPGDLEEYADMIFLVFDACRRAGYTYNLLVRACWRKLDKNMRRTWAKPVPGGDEPVEHVR